jgi:hypothetical protein
MGADNRMRNLLILRAPSVEGRTVTAEVASSSLVVPAILFNQLGGMDLFFGWFCGVLCVITPSFAPPASASRAFLLASTRT